MNQFELEFFNNIKKNKIKQIKQKISTGKIDVSFNDNLPIIEATSLNIPSLVTFFLNHKDFTFNKYVNFALAVAIKNKNKEIIEILYNDERIDPFFNNEKAGFNLNKQHSSVFNHTKMFNKYDCLSLSIAVGNYYFTKKLLKDPRLNNNNFSEDDTPLDIATCFKPYGENGIPCFKTFQLILNDKRTNATKINEHSIMCAIQNNQENYIAFLLDKKAINTSLIENKLIQTTIEFQRHNILELLLSKISKISITLTYFILSKSAISYATFPESLFEIIMNCDIINNKNYDIISIFEQSHFNDNGISKFLFEYSAIRNLLKQKNVILFNEYIKEYTQNIIDDF
jgi:hypothetical protein